MFSDYTWGLKLYIEKIDFMPYMDTFSSGLVSLVCIAVGFVEYCVVTFLLRSSSCELSI